MEVLELCRMLLSLVVSIIGIEKAKAELSELDVRLANASADAIELARWGRTSVPPQ
jgi:hypothetical protein